MTATTMIAMGCRPYAELPEEWRPVAGFPAYSVSSHGRVRRDKVGRRVSAGTVLTPTLNELGYARVELWRNGKRACRRINNLVCAAFHGPAPSPKHHSAHDNGCPSDNRPENLRWATPTENAKDRHRHGTDAIGENNPAAKLTFADVIAIRATEPYFGVGRDLARKYGVAQSVISGIRRGRTWRMTPQARSFPDIVEP
ncbi:NUMOD4 domain-containing protein [Reyranella sp.]|jgi:hypothetical protein|uniref:NUMOD4 domain-containing protein n=1 Tax=Reyranella sp. TaxID=1929291 RepID=UPI000BC5F9C6|nr:NUMOD4 domain-containing protein [Reyranella sp.]OYY35615.1 MAG: hypothetical protein B7Y57_25890 [Rhodospirillales bacterium 35-66-84]OYZ91485.1 MAG: hypothetical protein B7Y08_25760 [Rhodospirillales bacterium 24-66-33]OZB22022.1 MAG: hypothetical protein B7X63_24685 [Rhodospirillales bacterium 39-66-50]HQS14958.1 NUMOD4 domain-containing protein [Reyranella sp.]HQT10767.1 NUMOD4 domain-containing protein [Reyranella sp.]